MLTTRGWLFVLTVVPLLALAMLLPIVDVLPPFGHQSLVLVGFTLLGWFLLEWFLFAVRVRTVLRQLPLQRELCDERGEVVNLWAGRTFEVRVRVGCPTWPGLPQLMLSDRVPFGVELTGGEESRNSYEGGITP